MKSSSIRNMAIAVSALFISQAAMADEFSVNTGKRPFTIGLGALYKDKPYKDYDSGEKTSAVPLILYEGENFFVRGSSLGWDFLDSKAMELAVVGEMQNGGYDSSDSSYLRGMSDRDASFGAGGHFVWKPENLGLKLAAVTDVTNNSDGTEVRGEVFYTHKTGDLMLKPYGGIIWQSEDYNDYYYGVRNREVNAAIGRTAYSADSDTNFRLGAMAVYQGKTSPWMFIGGLRYDFLSDEIDDSPIVDDDNELSVVLGVGYSFGK